MPTDIRNVRIFIASPGGLDNERLAIRDLQENMNLGSAKFRGCRIEIVGWEDTISQNGRPQEIINEELDTCDLFIGLLAERWGSSTGNKEFSSGFEEEYKRSFKRYETVGKPEMSLYFKDVKKDDPGDQQKKVIQFQNEISESKTILYGTFTEPENLKDLVRLRIEKYIYDLDKIRDNKQPLDEAVSIQLPSYKNIFPKEKEYKSNFNIKLFNKFIEKNAEQSEDVEIKSLDVARLRLIANSHSNDSNDQSTLGPHDSNLIFMDNRRQYKWVEYIKLFEAGLQNINISNTPIWTWYRILTSKKHNKKIKIFPYLLQAATKKNTSKHFNPISSLEFITLLGLEIVTIDELIKRTETIRSWFAAGMTSKHKLAALHYLKKMGENEDIAVVKIELDRANSETSKLALETLVSIKFKHDKLDALKTIYDNQFESFDEALIKKILASPAELDTRRLQRGLTHKNKYVRFNSLKKLSEKDNIASNELEFFINDNFVENRFLALNIYTNNFRTVDDEIAKKYIYNKQSSSSSAWATLMTPTTSLLSTNVISQDEHACFNNYLKIKYQKLSKDDLYNLIKNNADKYPTAYLVFIDKYYQQYSSEIRNRAKNQYAKAELETSKPTKIKLPLTGPLTENRRTELTRGTLDIIYKRKQSKDINTFRKCLEFNTINSSALEMLFLQKNGEWQDIEYVLKTERYFKIKPGFFSFDTEWKIIQATTIYSIGKNNISDLLKLHPASDILTELIKLFSLGQVKKLTDEELDILFDYESDSVRKAIALQCVRALNIARLKHLLNRYINSDKTIYYNILHWLDFGISMPKNTSARVARTELLKSY